MIKGDIDKKINDKNVVLQDLKEAIDDFNKNRNWIAYHNAMNLAMSINIEAAELLEIFQWSDKKDADRKARLSHNEHLKEELADILIYCINLANAYGIDISSCIIEKLHKNAKKYPSK
ncbi:MAG: nucleotide pyrophosphohydrolase [Lachnospiraceae bacterium]|nr:nucleotide pyrophosphohydrolase [Lachnospiraceae bacterium]MBP3544083.1 nucleotide pyrophosphohydrolase [Lachnospiraceae bacterium]